MDRNEFMELVYETFADEPDNVLANGIIEAADAYVEYEKAKLLQEGTTKDTISRQAAIDALRKCQTYLYDARDPELKIELSSADAAIKELPTIQPEPQWIPVSERLPEKGGEYLVSVHHTIGAISVFHPEKDTYVDDVAIMKYYGKFPSTVRAWMPLLKAYKGERT